MNLWSKLMCYCRSHSPWLFHMNSGSCNGCDIEIVAALSPRYDAEQLGVRLEGSPRHADILCVTGPVTHNAVGAIKTVYSQVFGPKAVVAIGSCPATTNVFIDSRTLASTVAYETAERMGVRAASRKVFLDDTAERGAIVSQIELAARDATRDGHAVAIGHPHPATIAALAEEIPRLEARGIHFVFASDVVR